VPSTFICPPGDRIQLARDRRIAGIRRGDERCVERVMATLRAHGTATLEQGRHVLHQGAALVGIVEQHLDDRVHGHGVVVVVPAVVVGDHGDGRVAHLRFAGELGLGHVRHADHRAAPGAVELALGAGRELRPFHDHVGAAALVGQLERAGRVLERVAEPAAHRVGHRHVRDQPGLEERFRAREGAVDELVDDHEGARRQVGAQRADRADRQDFRHPDALEGVDVGPEIQRRRRHAVAAAVARQEHQLLAVELAEHQIVGRLAERRQHALPAHVGQPVDGVDAAAADDADERRNRGHDASSERRQNATSAPKAKEPLPALAIRASRDQREARLASAGSRV